MWRAFPEGIRLEVAEAVPGPGRSRGDLVEPFVPIGARGRFSRTLLARVVGPNGECVREVALKLQSDEYPVAELPGWSNCDVDHQWDQQWRLWRVAAEAGAAPAFVDVLPLAPDGGAPLLPPTLYCKERRAFFATPCPECGRTLETCRDGKRLEDHGLPRYDRSLERFLHCRECSAEGRPPQFYALIVGDPQLPARAPVGEQTDLYSALGRLARNGGPLPCAGCQHVSSCHPEQGPGDGDAGRLLTPLSFYEYRCLPMERLHVHFDEFAAVLGGRLGGEPSRGQRAPRGGGGAERQYLFGDDPREKLPLEILNLKLTLFTQLVAAVGALQRATGLPHLALSPENVMVDTSAAAARLPALYGFRTRLLGVGALRRRRINGLDSAQLAVPVLEPPPVHDATHRAPLLAGGGEHYAGSFRIDDVSVVGDALVAVAGELRSDAFDLRTVESKDALQVIVRQGRPLPLAVEFLANPSRCGDDGLQLRSAAFAAEPAQVQRLRTLIGQAPVRVTFVVHHCLHVPCDLQSLGLMLFTLLAVDAEQGPAEVAGRARELCERMVQFRRDRPEAGVDDLGAYADQLVRQAEELGWLATRRLCANFTTAPEGGDPAVRHFWRVALMLGLRALTPVNGFGFCRAHDDFDPSHPEGPADHLLAELQVLGHNIDAALLGMRGKRREIGEAVSRVRAAAGVSSAGRSERRLAP